MPRARHPHRGSMQFWPRARSSKHSARVRSWAETKEKKILGFVGYKAGMTHLLVKEANPNSHKKSLDIFMPVTVIECPPMKVYSIRYYMEDENGQPKVISEVFSKKVEKELKRKTGISKKENAKSDEFDNVRLVVYTQPKLTGIGKKKPDMVEIEVGGSSLQEKAEFALSFLDKDVKVSDVFKNSQFIDIHSVTKGKGFSGTIKKFGVKRLQHKSEKKVRGIGTLGSWHPNKVKYTVAQPGKFGYHLRTEYNKTSIKIGNKPEEINPAGGFIRYGFVKNDYLLVKGSVSGAVKRPITVTEATRVKKKMFPHEVTYISLESKQR